MVLLGRVLGAGESFLKGFRPAASPAPAAEAGKDLDKTGRVVSGASRIPVAWREGDLLFPAYDSLAHSLWRAQELSLFNRARARLAGPILDVGCGDGSFSSLIFDRLDVGLDKDAAAMETARAYGFYGRLVEGTDESIPLPDASMGSALCNSVFEHVVDLEPLLRELARVIRPGGLLAFTVPVKGFERHLSRFFGRRFSRDLNAEYHHRNLLEPGAWKDLLRRTGFEAVETLAYQPPVFTWWYVLLRYAGTRRGLGRIPGFRRALWSLLSPRLVSLLRASLAGTADGANLFVLAKRA